MYLSGGACDGTLGAPPRVRRVPPAPRRREHLTEEEDTVIPASVNFLTHKTEAELTAAIIKRMRLKAREARVWGIRRPLRGAWRRSGNHRARLSRLRSPSLQDVPHELAWVLHASTGPVFRASFVAKLPPPLRWHLPKVGVGGRGADRH